MSHFSVAVITSATQSVEEALQPFHEYECTGTKDQYVVFVKAEQTLEELKQEYKNSLSEYLESTPEDLGQFLNEEYGYELKSGEWGKMTNPNAKWDWWTVGGRWSNMLMSKEGKEVNKGIIKELDFQKVIDTAWGNALIEHDKVSEIANGRTWLSWDAVRESENSIGEAREIYNNQDVLLDLRKKYDNPFMSLDQFLSDREEYGKTKGNAAISTFAVIKDGIWYEKGEMGWFGCVSDEKEQNDWNGEFLELLKSCPDDHLLTIVDCHI